MSDVSNMLEAVHSPLLEEGLGELEELVELDKVNIK
tara:strand:- start:1848 stop:1955 length:108 start_codon:yes stop_codon:yes gene_type:complete